MLRRSKQRQHKVKNSRTHIQPLGTNRKRPKTDDEKELESLVLGKGEDIIDTLQHQTDITDHIGRAKVQSENKDSKEERKPVWEDQDEHTGSIELPKIKKFDAVRKSTESTVKLDQYTTRLQTEFKKVSSTPNWAKLPSEKRSRKLSDGEDEDVDELQQRTGTYLEKSKYLPKNVIQIKSCPNANRDKPSKAGLSCVEFHPSAQVILTASINQTLSLYQVDGLHNPTIQSVFVENFPIYTAHFTADGKEVVMGSKHKSFYYYDMIAGKIINVPKIKGLEENNMKRFVISPDNKYIAFLGSNGAIHLISSKSKEWIQSFKMNGNVDSLAFSSDGKSLYSFGENGMVYVWDMLRRDCIHHFYDDGCVTGTVIAASPNGKYLACGSHSGIVNVYETETCLKAKYPKPVREIKNLTTPCTSALFNSDTEILALASNYTEKAVKLVHFPSMTVFSNYPDRNDSNIKYPQCLHFSPNSGYFSMGNNKGAALLYRVKHYGNY